MVYLIFDKLFLELKKTEIRFLGFFPAFYIFQYIYKESCEGKRVKTRRVPIKTLVQ